MIWGDEMKSHGGRKDIVSGMGYGTVRSWIWIRTLLLWTWCGVGITMLCDMARYGTIWDLAGSTGDYEHIEIRTVIGAKF